MAKILGVSIISATRHKINFDNFYKSFTRTNNYFSMVSCLSGMYKVMRKYGDASFCESTTLLYDILLERVKECEDTLINCFIVESKPHFRQNDEYFNKIKFSRLDDQEKLDYIVWLSRKSMLEHFHNYDEKITSLDSLHLTNECRNTSYLVHRICESFDITSKVIKIPAAFSDEINLYNGSGYHYFVLVTINDKEYIVDCTYRQFFRGDANNIERLGVVGLGCCDPGVFMMMNKQRKEVALTILKNGWIRSTNETLKHYLDGFTLSYRNGLYYDWLGQVDYSVGYTARNYLEFLNGYDLITNYEPIEGLGKQEEPLKNKSLKFRFK